jgi:hypothetical protein
MYRKVYTIIDAMSAAGGFFALAFPFGSLCSSGYQNFLFRASMVSSLFRYKAKPLPKKDKKEKKKE